MINTQKVTKTKMAKMMNTSRAVVDSLLNPHFLRAFSNDILSIF